MTKEAKARIEQSLKRADEALAKDRNGAISKALEKVTGDEGKKVLKEGPAPEKARKGKKGKQADKLAASRVEIDTAGYAATHGKQPGTGKRDPKAVWRFQIGAETLEVATEFYRDAKAKAVAKAIELNALQVAVLA